MKTSTIQGYYGKANACYIYVLEQSDGAKWYATEGSTNVNCTYDDLNQGVNVERVKDFDSFQADTPIDSEEALEREVADFNGESEPEAEPERLQTVIITMDELGHDAVLNNSREEIAGVLEQLAKRIREYGVLNCDGVHLRDSNGNGLGSVAVDFY